MGIKTRKINNQTVLLPSFPITVKLSFFVFFFRVARDVKTYQNLRGGLSFRHVFCSVCSGVFVSK